MLDESYLEYRLATIRYLARGLNDAGVPTVQPPGGHAVFIDACKLLPHIPPAEFPGQALACGSTCRRDPLLQIGSVMFGGHEESSREAPPRLELVRLAIPRRVYTQSHVDRIIEICAAVARRSGELRGMEMTYAPTYLRHFTARFRPLEPGSAHPRSYSPDPFETIGSLRSPA